MNYGWLSTLFEIVVVATMASCAAILAFIAFGLWYAILKGDCLGQM
jgi:hypothetical protein